MNLTKYVLLFPELFVCDTGNVIPIPLFSPTSVVGHPKVGGEK